MNKDLLAVLEGFEDLELYFRLVFTIHLQVVDGDSDFSGKDIDSLGSLRFGDFNVAAHEHISNVCTRKKKMIRDSRRNVFLQR